MNAITIIKSLLRGDTSITPEGQFADLTLPKKAGVVRRRRDYRVYLPAGYDGQTALPMVMVLHGCKQNNAEMETITGFNQIADREGFIVVYPYITSHTGLRSRNCWGWWLPRQRVRDTGEVGDLHQIVLAVCRDYCVDSNRLHVCGLSAGAAMSVVALATYSDIWKSGASVAGVAYGESARAVRYASAIPVRYKPLAMLNRQLGNVLVSEPPDLLVIQSTTDRRVDIQAAENLVETWRFAASLADQPTDTTRGVSQSKPWRFSQFSDDDGRVRLGYLTVEDIDHGWIGGNPGKYSTPEAPNVSELIWAFFNRRESESLASESIVNLLDKRAELVAAA